MAYRKVALQTLPSWRAVDCFHLGPRGTALGSAFDPHLGFFAVHWALDGSIIWQTEPFDVVVAPGALNASGEALVSVRPFGESRIRPVLIRGGSVVRDLAGAFADHAIVNAFNAAGIAVGGEVITGTPNLRPFAVDVRAGTPVRYLEPPAGTLSSQALGLNEAGDVLIMGHRAYGDFHSLLYVDGGPRRELGAYVLTDINEHRVCSGYQHGASDRAGLLDVSTPPPRWTELPVPAGAVHTRGRGVNDKGQCIVLAEYGSGSSRHFLPFLWRDGALYRFDELVAGDYLVPAGLSEAGDVITTDLAPDVFAEGRKPVLLTSSRPVRSTVDLGRPLWELIMAGTTPSGGPSFGVGGVSVRLPNGQVIDLPTIPIPNEPVPGPEWASLNEAQRVALLSGAVSALASQVHDQHARRSLTQAAHDLLKRPGN